MARSTSEAEFDKLVIQDQATIMASRGAKSQFSQLDLPIGEYYGQIIETSRSVFDMEQKDENGTGTGTKVPTKRVQFTCLIIADANPRCAPEEIEKYSGKQEFMTFVLPTGNKDASDRFMATLGEMGVPTEQFVASERDIKNPATQLTLAQGLQMIDDEKPYCKLAVTGSKGSDRKYLNFRSCVTKLELEAYLGHPIGDNYQVASDPNEAPFDDNQQQAGEEVPVWDEQVSLWWLQSNDTFYDNDGNPVDNPYTEAAPEPEPEPAPVAPPVRRPPATRTVTSAPTPSQQPHTAPAARTASPASRAATPAAKTPPARRSPPPRR